MTFATAHVTWDWWEALLVGSMPMLAALAIDRIAMARRLRVLRERDRQQRRQLRDPRHVRVVA